MEYLERVVVNNLKTGDEKAFEYIFKSYFHSLFHYAQHLLHSNYRAEEVVSDVFARLWEHRGQITIESSLKSYLFRTVYHQCLNQMRQLKVEDKYRLYFLNYFMEAYSSGSGYPLESIIEKELENKISDVINSLPEQCRVMFLLSRDEELSHEEIAKRYGVSVNTVHTQIARALRRLKEELKDYLPLLAVLLSRGGV
jgi:RNA polymerase sigma-70 factor, ECF subfamily